MNRFYIVLLAVAVTADPELDCYMEYRESLIEEELAMRVGANLQLDPREKLVNKFLMKLKNETIQKSIWTNTPYPPSISFFKSKPWIDSSTIYKIIRAMPKGGVLHLHDSAMTSFDWLIGNVTYLPNLYTRFQKKGNLNVRRYMFSESYPGEDWVSVAKMRSEAKNVKVFDNSLKLDMSIWVDDPFRAYPSVNDVWGKFETYFSTMKGLTSTPELSRMYLQQGLKEFHEDGVQYIEMKTGPKSDSNGNDQTDVYMDMVIDVVNKFKAQYPDFIGVKVIIAGRRGIPNQTFNVNRTIQLMKKYPDLVKGFDLLQQEDVTHWTVHFSPDLLEKGKARLPYFFHSGETDWTQWVDLNLIDSVLMNATRIGHGYAVYHHPKVMEAVMKNNIAIELCPISNQVLGLVNDLRNHPGAYLIANGAPIVISSDDPPVWLSTPLSHDFYMAFMALGSVNDDLRLLKQLALNSITYSTMTVNEKAEAKAKWQKKWNEFISATIEKYHLFLS